MYKNSTKEKLETVNKGARKVTQILKVDNHKEELAHKIPYRLINPSNIGKAREIIISLI